MRPIGLDVQAQDLEAGDYVEEGVRVVSVTRVGGNGHLLPYVEVVTDEVTHLGRTISAPGNWTLLIEDEVVRVIRPMTTTGGN